MLTKKEIEDKYWVQFTFDEPIEYIPRLYDKKNKNEVDSNKILKIYPILMNQYAEFFYSIKSLQYDKNSEGIKEVIKMSYLDYILYLFEKDKQNEFGIEDERYNVMGRFLFILSNSLKIKTEKIKFAVDKRGKNIIVLNSDHHFVKVDKFENGCFFVVKEAMSKNEIELNSINYINAMYGHTDEIKLNDYVIDIGQNNEIILTSKDIDNLKQIICYQNIYRYDDTYIDPYVKKDLERYEALMRKRNGNNSISLKRQIFDIMLNFNQYKDINDIKNIPINTFTEMSMFICDRDNFKRDSLSQRVGLVTFEKPISHYLVDNVNIYENMVSQESLERDINNV